MEEEQMLQYTDNVEKLKKNSNQNEEKFNRENFLNFMLQLKLK